MNKNHKALIGLSSNEYEIISKITNQPLSVTDLSKATNIPKTTLNYLVRKLKRRGWITSIPHGKRQLWVTLQSSDLQQLFIDISALFSDCKNKQSIQNIYSSQMTNLKIYHGTKNIYTLWSNMASFSKSGRLYAIQPDISFNLALKYLVKEVGYDNLIKINNQIKQNKIIVDAIVHRRSIKTVANTLSSEHQNPIDFLKSFSGRSASTVELPDDFMNIPLEIYLYKKTLAIIYWPEQLAITIDNENIASFFLSIFESIKFLSKKYNQNELAAQEVVRLSNDN